MEMVVPLMIEEIKNRPNFVLVEIAEQPKDQAKMWPCFELEACISVGPPCKALPAPVLYGRRSKWKTITTRYM